MLLKPQDRREMQTRTLMALGAGLLQAGAPRVGAPGPGFGGALQNAMQETQRAETGILNRRMAQVQMDGAKQTQDLNAAKLAAAQKAATRQAKADELFLGNGETSQGALTDPRQRAMYQADPAAFIKVEMSKSAQKPIFQKRAMPGGKVQEVVSYDNGRTFQNFGETYNRQKQTSAQLNAAALGYKPGTPEHQNYLLAATRKNLPGTKKAIDTQTKKLVYVSEKDIADGNGRYQPVPSGLKVTSDGEGGLTLVSGDMASIGGGDALTKPNQSKVQMKQINASNELGRVRQIMADFKPEYLQLGTRLNMAGAAMKDFIGISLDEATKAELTGYTKFRRGAIENLNTILNELSGAAVSPAEGKRIAASRPNAGTGIFDGDSPTEFKAKMEGVQTSLRNAVMRHAYAMKRGLDPLKTGIPLDKVPDLVERRGREIAATVQKDMPKASKDARDLIVRDRLRSEFGI